MPIFLFVCLLNLSTILSFCMRKILGYIKGNFHGIYGAKTVSFIRYQDYWFFFFSVKKASSYSLSRFNNHC